VGCCDESCDLCWPAVPLVAGPAGLVSRSATRAQYQLPSTCADFQNLMLAINAIITPLIPNVALPSTYRP